MHKFKKWLRRVVSISQAPAAPSSIGTVLQYITKLKLHSSCEIEDFVETHLCKLCVILKSRVLLVVCPHQGYRSATPFGTRV